MVSNWLTTVSRWTTSPVTYYLNLTSPNDSVIKSETPMLTNNYFLLTSLPNAWATRLDDGFFTAGTSVFSFLLPVSTYREITNDRESSIIIPMQIQ